MIDEIRRLLRTATRRKCPAHIREDPNTPDPGDTFELTEANYSRLITLVEDQIKLDDVPFPTSEEAKEILAEAGIDTTNLEAKVMRRLCDIKGHRWELFWPLDPCEYSCSRCGKKVIS